MEPLDDKELNELLRRWEAPVTPPTLRNRIPQRPSSRWRWFLTGTIRIPVPVGLAARWAPVGLDIGRQTGASSCHHTRQFRHIGGLSTGKTTRAKDCR